jgi:excisionase family DNA binding protein
MTEAEVIRIVHRALDLYKARHPRPIQVNTTQAAKMLGLGVPTVRKLVHTGKLRFDKCGLIPIEQVDNLLAAPE